jgi:hypothetical protein
MTAALTCHDTLSQHPSRCADRVLRQTRSAGTASGEGIPRLPCRLDAAL